MAKNDFGQEGYMRETAFAFKSKYKKQHHNTYTNKPQPPNLNNSRDGTFIKQYYANSKQKLL